MKRRRRAEVNQELIVELYSAGESIEKIARRLGHGELTISGVLREQGVTIRPARIGRSRGIDIAEDVQRRVIADVEAGMSFSRAGRKNSLSHATVAKIWRQSPFREQVAQ